MTSIRRLQKNPRMGAAKDFSEKMAALFKESFRNRSKTGIHRFSCLEKFLQPLKSLRPERLPKQSQKAVCCFRNFFSGVKFPDYPCANFAEADRGIICRKPTYRSRLLKSFRHVFRSWAGSSLPPLRTDSATIEKLSVKHHQSHGWHIRQQALQTNWLQKTAGLPAKPRGVRQFNFKIYYSHKNICVIFFCRP